MVVACAVFVGVADPTPAIAAWTMEPGPTEPVRVALEIDPSALPPSRTTDDVVAWLEEKIGKTFAEADVEVDGRAETEVRLVLSRFGEHDVHYRIDAGIFMPSRDELQYARRLDCEACSDTEMVEMVSRYAAGAAGWLHSADAREPADADVDDDVAARTTIKPERPRDDEPRLGRLGIAGAILATGGVVGVITGAALVGVGRRDSVDAADGKTLHVTDLRTPGIAVLVTGGALLATGVALLVVDQTRRKRRASAMTAVPTWTRGGLGLSITGRF